ncbi:MAG: hypothetical protein ACXIVQ_01805 [Acidimicrobiales bacterium]
MSVPLRRIAAVILVGTVVVSTACTDDPASDSAVAPDGDRSPVHTPTSTGPTTSAVEGRPTGDDHDPAQPCPVHAVERSFASVADVELAEISGAVVGRHSPDILWVHQDSGHPAVLTALDRDDGSTVGTWRIEGPDPTDWEDIALATDPGGEPWLFVGDIGDNRGIRDHVEVVRVREPRRADTGGVLSGAERMQLVSPLDPTDAEALLVDQRSGDIVVVTKSISGAAHVLVAPGGAWAPDGARLDMIHAGTIERGFTQAVLAGDVAADGSVIVLRTPTTVLWWERDAGASVAETILETDPCRSPSVFDPLGEAVALTPEGGYILLGEAPGAPMHRALPAELSSE